MFKPTCLAFYLCSCLALKLASWFLFATSPCSHLSHSISMFFHSSPSNCSVIGNSHHLPSPYTLLWLEVVCIFSACALRRATLVYRASVFQCTCDVHHASALHCTSILDQTFALQRVFHNLGTFQHCKQFGAL